MGKRKPDLRQPRVTIEGEVLRQIRQHARSNSKTEVCGVLIGEENGNGVNVSARIPGLNAAQAGTYVTFTQDTWEHIYKIKDKEYPEERIVGWYHSHPGFGVFLSDHDTFIHQNFFSSALQVAWVYDPHSDEEGCFGWSGERLERVAEIHVKDEKGGEEAGETGKPEPVGGIEDGEEIAQPEHQSEVGPPIWLKWMLTLMSHGLLAAIAFVFAWLFFPRLVFYFIDVNRGIVSPAPAGTHIDRDGAVVIPGITDGAMPLPEKNMQAPPQPGSAGNQGPKQAPEQSPQAPEQAQRPSAKPADSGKDKNVPRK
jgi:proteasome lid subunit RPN8/RPN11